MACPSLGVSMANQIAGSNYDMRVMTTEHPTRKAAMRVTF